jgi:hypothetical protein
MASGYTNRGKFLILQGVFRNTGLPTNFYVALATSATTPLSTHTTFSSLTEIANGNGYTTGGFSLTKNSTDFDVLTEAATTLIQIKDVVWTATTANLPASGNGARWAVLLDDNVTIGSRQILAWWDLVSDRTVSVGQTLTLQNCELDLT